MEKLLRIEQVAEMLSVQKRQIYLLTHQKRIPYIRGISGLRFRLSEIEKWIEQNSITPLPYQSRPKPAGAGTGKKRGRPRKATNIDIDKLIESAKAEVLS